MIRKIFSDLIVRTAGADTLSNTLWAEIEAHYGAPVRHYHTLRHLEHLLAALQSCHNLIRDYDAVLFAAFYHDIIYNVPGSDNEERSAGLALERMEQLGIPASVREKCCQLILATKAHNSAEDPDTDLFTDADLAILGSEAAAYAVYSSMIRAEYAIYPDALYFPGRKQVLQHFLDMPRIYKTDFFFHRYENAARLNIRTELDSI